MAEDFREILRQPPSSTGGHSDYTWRPPSYDTLVVQRPNTLLPALVAAAGAVLIAVSPVLPWLHITAPFLGSMNFSLLDGLSLAGSGGLHVLVLAAFIAGGLSLILSLTVRNHLVGRIIPALTGLAATGYGAYLLIKGASALSEAKSAEVSGFVLASLGVGFWTFLVGGPVLVVGAFLPPYPRH